MKVSVVACKRGAKKVDVTLVRPRMPADSAEKAAVRLSVKISSAQPDRTKIPSAPVLPVPVAEAVREAALPIPMPTETSTQPEPCALAEPERELSAEMLGELFDRFNSGINADEDEECDADEEDYSEDDDDEYDEDGDEEDYADSDDENDDYDDEYEEDLSGYDPRDARDSDVGDALLYDAITALLGDDAETAAELPPEEDEDGVRKPVISMRYFHRDADGTKFEVDDSEAIGQEAICVDQNSGKLSRICGYIKRGKQE